MRMRIPFERSGAGRLMDSPKRAIARAFAKCAGSPHPKPLSVCFTPGLPTGTKRIKTIWIICFKTASCWDRHEGCFCESETNCRSIEEANDELQKVSSMCCGRGDAGRRDSRPSRGRCDGRI